MHIDAKHAEFLERQGVYAHLYAVNYGLSHNGVAAIGDSGVPVPALAMHE